ncbi:MAG TPA: RnfABCDGE type electron transport complex subunit B [Spirochaetota bacterium]|nr:RnfABCDGE type electron transport complex subunit B [Spirochaetota bacterium]
MNALTIVFAAGILLVLGAFFGILLTFAQKKLHVPKDEKTELIEAALPGVNCGACGEAGCAAYAAKIVKGEAAVNLCPVGGQAVSDRIAEIMGIEKKITKPLTARIHCQGGSDKTTTKHIYNGPKTCKAAAMINGGPKVCSFGCIGYGDCAAVCPFDAITMSEKHLPVVDPEKCTGCGICVKECPKNIISLLEKEKEVYVKCSNKEKGATMRQGCKVGCIACNLCVAKACKIVFQDNPKIDSAIDLKDFLAQIDYSLCIDCGKCAEVCPQKVIQPKSGAAI